MKVIIPVAGIGARLQPHTFALPKPLLQVADKPMLAHILEPLKALNPDEVLFIIGHKGEMIREYVDAHFSFKCRYVQQDKLLGLGYAISLALQELEEDGPLLVILGDTIVECDLARFINTGPFVLGLRQVADPERFGIAELADGRIIRLIEKAKKPPTNLALIGLYYFKNQNLLREELKKLVKSGKTTSGEIQLTDALQGMIEAGTSFVPFEVQGWFDCGKRQTLLETNRHFLKKLPEAKQIEGCRLIPPVYIAPSATIERSVIGPNVSVDEAACVKGSVLENSIVGKEALVENIVATDSLIGPGAIVRGNKKSINIGPSSEYDSCCLITHDENEINT